MCVYVCVCVYIYIGCLGVGLGVGVGVCGCKTNIRDFIIRHHRDTKPKQVERTMENKTKMGNT